MSLVIVASTNPVKINAAKLACEAMFPETVWDVKGVAVTSGVSDQPLSDKETRQGAMNRVHAARALSPDADYWIAFEGGIEDTTHGMESFAWIAIASRGEKAVSESRSGMFFIPPAMAALIRDGMELCHADDHVTGRENSKQTNGTVGLLTGDVIDRTAYYVHAAILALIPFKHPRLYSPKD